MLPATEAGVIGQSPDKNNEVGGMPVREGIVLLLMAFVTLGLYYPAMLAPYCFLDDRLLEHDVLNTPSWSYLANVFRPNEGGLSGGAYFRPFSNFVFLVIANVFGLEPAPFHLFNVLVHLASGLLVYIVIKRMYGSVPTKTWLGFIAAMLFLLHPVNVEAVAWISGRPTVLSTFFMLLAFSLHMRLERAFWDWRLFAAGLCYFLSLLSYELAAFMPLALLYWDLERDTQRAWRKSALLYYRRWLVYGAVFAAYALYRLGSGVLEPGTEGGTISMGFSFLEAFLESPSSPVVAIGLYLKKVFWPWPLSIYIDGVSPETRPYYLALGLTFPLALGWWIWRRAWPRFWGSWFLCGLLVVLPLSFHSFSWTGAAERYVYLSSISFAVCVSLLACKVMMAQPRWAAPTAEALVLLLLLVFGISTTKRVELWQSNVALFKDALEKNPTVGRLATAYGGALRLAGKTEEAVALWHKAVELGDVAIPSRFLGDVERERKNYVAAEKYYLRALWPIGKLSGPEAKPVRELGLTHQRDPDIYLALADLHIKMAEKDPTRIQYHRDRVTHFLGAASKLCPRDAYCRYLLAKTHLSFGNIGEARKIFAEVSDMAPGTYYGKAAAKLAKGAQVPVQVSPSNAPSFDSPGALRLE